MRVRKQLITNLYLKDKDIKKLTNGYVVYKRANKHAHALIPSGAVALIDSTKKIAAIKERITYHDTKMRALMNKLPSDMKFNVPNIVKAINSIKGLTKRPYIKKNPKYWKERSEFMKKHSPLLRKEPLNANN